MSDEFLGTLTQLDLPPIRGWVVWRGHLAVLTNDGLLLATDGSGPFAPLGDLANRAIVRAGFSGERAAAMDMTGALLVSDDAGRSWREVEAGSPDAALLREPIPVSAFPLLGVRMRRSEHAGSMLREALRRAPGARFDRSIERVRGLGPMIPEHLFVDEEASQVISIAAPPAGCSGQSNLDVRLAVRRCEDGRWGMLRADGQWALSSAPTAAPVARSDSGDFLLFDGPCLRETGNACLIELQNGTAHSLAEHLERSQVHDFSATTVLYQLEFGGELRALDVETGTSRVLRRLAPGSFQRARLASDGRTVVAYVERRDGAIAPARLVLTENEVRKVEPPEGASTLRISRTGLGLAVGPGGSWISLGGGQRWIPVDLPQAYRGFSIGCRGNTCRAGSWAVSREQPAADQLVVLVPAEEDASSGGAMRCSIGSSERRARADWSAPMSTGQHVFDDSTVLFEWTMRNAPNQTQHAELTLPPGVGEEARVRVREASHQALWVELRGGAPRTCQNFYVPVEGAALPAGPCAETSFGVLLPNGHLGMLRGRGEATRMVDVGGAGFSVEQDLDAARTKGLAYAGGELLLAYAQTFLSSGSLRVLLVTHSGERRSRYIDYRAALANPCADSAVRADSEVYYLGRETWPVGGTAEEVDELFDLDFVEVVRSPDGTVCMRGARGRDGWVRAAEGAFHGESAGRAIMCGLE